MLDVDIARFCHIARGVRSLDFSSPGNSWDPLSRRTPRGITLTSRSLRKLMSRTGDILLPSLTRLKLPVTPPYDSDPTFLICPSLRELTISFPDFHLRVLSGKNIDALFSGIFKQNPCITTLRVESEFYTSHDPQDEGFAPYSPHAALDADLQHPAIPWWMHQAGWIAPPSCRHQFCDALAAVAMLRHLEVFHMMTMNTGVISRKLVEALSILPVLSVCSFGILIPDLVLPTIRPGFATLRALALSNIAHGGQLCLFDSPHLQDLAIYHADGGTNQSYLQTLEAALTRFPDLRSLSWTPLRENVRSSATPILADVLRPLYALYSLQELRIDVADCPIGTNDIALLAEGLPHLSHLELKFCMDSMGPTTRSLLLLAQNCPLLRTLRLGGLRLTNSHDEPNALTLEPLGHRLRCITVANLRCQGALCVAMILDCLFPFLDLGECRRSLAKVRSPRGDFPEVLRRLEAFHAERM